MSPRRVPVHEYEKKSVAGPTSATVWALPTAVPLPAACTTLSARDRPVERVSWHTAYDLAWQDGCGGPQASQSDKAITCTMTESTERYLWAANAEVVLGDVKPQGLALRVVECEPGVAL